MAREEIFHQVDRKLAESKSLVVRDEAETKRIADYALKLTKGNAVDARRLLRAVMYQNFGQTWDESLAYSDGGDDLPSEKDICDEMQELTRLGVDSMAEELARKARQSMMFEIADSPLYIGMAIDLLGREAAVAKINGLLKEIAFEPLGDEIFTECSWLYDQMAERFMAEWGDDLVTMRVFDALEVLDYWEGELRMEMTEEERGWTRNGYLHNCFFVDQMLNEALARGLVTENKKLTYTDKDSGEVKGLTFKKAMFILQSVNQ